MLTDWERDLGVSDAGYRRAEHNTEADHALIGELRAVAEANGLTHAAIAESAGWTVDQVRAALDREISLLWDIRLLAQAIGARLALHAVVDQEDDQ